MKIASIQMAVIEDDKNAAIEKALAKIRCCRGADLVILPEIWNVGFMSFDSYISTSEERNGPTMTMLVNAAREISAYIHTGSFVECENGKYYNSSYLVSPEGELLANYRKIHLFGYNSLETRILTPGNSVTVADTSLGKIGMATCYDLRFPELFRKMVDLGAEFFLICSAWPYPRLEAWQLFNRTRALENQCYLISANSVDMNRNTRFVGHSMVVDPWGTVIAGAGDKESILKVEIDSKEIQSAREEFPVLKSRRVNLIT
ncbi:conserved hypothetical protein [Desulfamplus magnetovallimortis]|uniref:CN hydrolase domain-containing protein n=1 Tax=Desulfamplus magnetovallimortis TaxID=1246637 RepID=A0A1W1HJ70_9BACT|nr:carbon-nitrogen family hydrolase [Desulfamplus magnetovallimortis]SLM32486.1 conserved hypothetical protein [Desulfamplus magnetovallimortis]